MQPASLKNDRWTRFPRRQTVYSPAGTIDSSPPFQRWDNEGAPFSRPVPVGTAEFPPVPVFQPSLRDLFKE